MNIYLDPVGDDKKDVLFRLLQYSLFEESLTDHNCIGEDGLFEYPRFENYFTDNDREAFFIREKENRGLLGFAMVNTYMQKYTAGHSIAEFMVLPGFRRSKIGKLSAFLCFDRYPGNWEVSPALGSRPAYFFWRNVIGDYTGSDIEFKDGIFAFSNAVNCKNNITIRRMLPEEYAQLRDFLYDAIYVPPGMDAPPRSVVDLPELSVYFECFGSSTDLCLVAEASGIVIGAVWTRRMTGKIKGYGTVDDQTPECSISVKEAYRNQGIGKMLMTEMIKLLKICGYTKVSLSVSKDNYAYRLYEKLGFFVVRVHDGDYVMILDL